MIELCRIGLGEKIGIMNSINHGDFFPTEKTEESKFSRHVIRDYKGKHWKQCLDTESLLLKLIKDKGPIQVSMLINRSKWFGRFTKEERKLKILAWQRHGFVSLEWIENAKKQKILHIGWGGKDKEVGEVIE